MAIYKFTDDDRREIKAAVEAAERRTSGEFVAVAAKSSDSYRSTSLIWAAGIAFILPALLLFFSHLRFVQIYQLQIACFIALMLLLEFVPSLHMALVPKATRRARARRLARAQFYEQGVHLTQDHSGVLLFVSLAERYVEIVADKGIHEKIGEERWQKVIAAFLEKVQEDDVTGGFLAAISACGEAMEDCYPAKLNNPDELSDGLIEI